MRPGILIGTRDEINSGEKIRQTLIRRCDGFPDTQEWLARLTIAHWFLDNVLTSAEELVKLHQTIEAFALVLIQKPDEHDWFAAQNREDAIPAAYFYDQIMATRFFGKVYR